MRFRRIFSFKAFMFFCPVLAALMLYGASPAAEVDVVRVQYRRAAELVPVVQSLLSPEGTVTLSERINSLVIVDTPEAIQRVHAYLDRFDRPVEQVRIQVRFHSMATDNQRAAAARGRYSSDDLSVATGGNKRDGVDIAVADRERRRISSSEAFVFAMSGSPAFIRAGKEIPYRRGSAFFRRYAPGDGTITWQNVESGFEVTPTIVGDNVHLKIVPRIAYDHRKDAVVRFFAAQTELTVPLGQWVEIGGGVDQQNEIIKEILSQNRSGENTATSMSLMVQRP
ncbi:MAG: secretin N-terminal domain-containing protein [Desulfobacterales bacterium]|jgi:type II secretory pathway component GspD/PulD (secretin)